MANSTITLAQAITAGAKLAVDTITGLFNGTAPPTDAVAQYAKVAYGPAGSLQTVDNTNRLPVETLGKLAVSRSQAATVASAVVTLTTTTVRASLLCLTAPVCIRQYTGADQAALTTDHYVQAGERIDIACDVNTKISVIRAGAADGVLRISELG